MPTELKTPAWLRKSRQLAEREWKSTHNYERRAVYLVDPSAVATIDARILDEVWPAIVGFFESSRFRLANGTLPNIEAEWSVYACRSVSFIFEDAKRPLRRETRPSWYCRGSIRCSLSGDSLSQYCAVSLPYRTDIELLHDVLKETSSGGIPSQLTLSSEPESDYHYHVSFEHGAIRQTCFGKTPRSRWR